MTMRERFQLYVPTLCNQSNHQAIFLTFVDLHSNTDKISSIYEVLAIMDYENFNKEVSGILSKPPKEIRTKFIYYSQ